MALQRKLALAAGVVNPDLALAHANRSDEREAIRCNGYPVLFRGNGGDLLRLSRRKSLAPQMALAINVYA